MFAFRRAGHRASGPRHRLELLTHLPSKPTRRQTKSTKGKMHFSKNSASQTDRIKNECKFMVDSGLYVIVDSAYAIKWILHRDHLYICLFKNYLKFENSKN